MKRPSCQTDNQAVAYIRVSTDEQVRGGVSLAAQEERLRAYATMSRLDLVEVIREEGVSASKALSVRPGGKALLSLVRKRTVQHVLALKLDRLFRDAADALQQTREWDQASIALHLVDLGGQTLNTTSAMGRFFLAMMAGFAELERNLIAERTSTALAYKKQHREVYSPTPYGYQREGKRLIIFPAEQAIVAQIQVWHSTAWSLHQIAKELNQRGTPTKRGGIWRASTVRYMLQNLLHKEAA